MNYKSDSHFIRLAIKYGCKTAKEFAAFLHKYADKIEVTSSGKEILQRSLF